MIDTLPRRRFLKFGAALPLAISGLPAASAAVRKHAPQRVIFINNSLGFFRSYFNPARAGQLDTSKYLALIECPEDVTVIENLYHPGMETSNHDSEKSFLTGAPKPEANTFQNTISLDQAIADEIGGDTRFRSIAMSLYDRGWGCSWDSRGRAISPMHDVDLIFDQLFTPENVQRKQQQLLDDQQILDSLKRDLAHVRSTGEIDPSHSVEQYQQLIRELEARLQHEAHWLKTEKPRVDNTLSRDARYAFSTKVENLFELAKLAFRTDSTRVITISMDWIYGAIKVPGATGGWHTLSHHNYNVDAVEQLSCIEMDIMRRFNQFLMDLKSIPQGQGSLLDHTTVVLGSNFGNASDHTCHRLPILVAGGGHKHQQHIKVEEKTPLCNLWLELLNAHNIDAGRFGSSQQSMRLLGA
ncbi:MAG: DUF1552 domain-containing protein [Planctomycetota bacterium]|nr:DUF1552 domain-containing protein [Planctomycetota bacterium]